jgi:hypothetical protein
MRPLAAAGCISLLSSLLFGQTAAPVPDTLKPPAAEHKVLEAHAIGVQIYTCSKDAEGHYAWILKGPDAELRDDSGRTLIVHSAGPTWQHRDGSKITGKVAAKADAPQPDSIPWLLLTADHSASGAGVLSTVTHVQRIHTTGGQPPAQDCNADNAGAESRSHYSADYLFFAP